jgi:hypothetical protein
MVGPGVAEVKLSRNMTAAAGDGRRPALGGVVE